MWSQADVHNQLLEGVVFTEEDCRVEMHCALSPGYRACVKGAVLVCFCDQVLDQASVWDKHMLDSEPDLIFLSFLYKSVALVPSVGLKPVLFVPNVIPPQVVQGISVLVQASPEPYCCAGTHSPLFESNMKLHSENPRKKEH